MTETYKVLAQLNPGAAALTDFYIVAAATQATISSITICNQAGAAGTFRISVAVAGEADDAKQYIYYDQPVAANKTFIATIGGTLGPLDVVRVYGSSASLSFNAFGVETTP